MGHFWGAKNGSKNEGRLWKGLMPEKGNIDVKKVTQK